MVVLGDPAPAIFIIRLLELSGTVNLRSPSESRVRLRRTLTLSYIMRETRAVSSEYGTHTDPCKCVI